MTRKHRRAGDEATGVLVAGDLFKFVRGDGTVSKGVTCVAAAQALEVSPKRVARAIKAGKLEGGKQGRDWWVDLEHLRQVLESGGWHSLGIRPGPQGPRKAQG